LLTLYSLAVLQVLVDIIFWTYWKFPYRLHKWKCHLPST